jgi:hypothetical protein
LLDDKELIVDKVVLINKDPYPTRHLLLTLKRLWQLDRVHGLPVVAAPVFFPSASKGKEYWWGTQDSSTVFLWDTMGDEDRRNSLETLPFKDTPVHLEGRII